MRKVIKWILIVVSALLALLLVAVVALMIYGQSKFKRTIADRPLYPITADTSPEGQARGKYLMEAVMSCDMACHSEGETPFAGYSEQVSQGPIAFTFAPSNITPDIPTGIGGWSDAEIARAIREGLDKDNVELVIMPAYNYHVLSDADVAAVVGYLRSLEPVSNAVPPVDGNSVAKVMNTMGMFGPPSLGVPITSEQTAPPPGTAEYGGYLVSLGACRDCHKVNLAGGAVPFSDPDDPQAANLTPAGEISSWSEADFLKAMHNGLRPDGSVIDPEAMPWPAYGRMLDEDLAAIFKYLQSLPAVQSGS